MKRSFADLLESLATHRDSEDVAIDVGWYLVARGGDSLRFLCSPVRAESSQPEESRVVDASLDLVAVAESLVATKSVTYQPPSSDRGFLPSEWQREVLVVMDAKRQSVSHKVGLLVIATGLGKTVIACLDVHREMCRSRDERVRSLLRKDAPPLQLDPRDNGEGPPDDAMPFRVLFLVHSKLIRDGAHQKFVSHFGVWYPRSVFFNYDSSGSLPPSLERVLFVFALFQSFDKLDARAFSHVIVDEVHHVLAPTYSKHVKQLLADPRRYVLGMTATLQHRNDPGGNGIRALFCDMVYFAYDWVAAKRTHFPQDVGEGSTYLLVRPPLTCLQSISSVYRCLRAARTCKRISSA